MTRATSWRTSIILLLALGVSGSNLGCNPVSTKPTSPATPRSTEPEKKGDTVKPPKPDPG